MKPIGQFLGSTNVTSNPSHSLHRTLQKPSGNTTSFYFVLITPAFKKKKLNT